MNGSKLYLIAQGEDIQLQTFPTRPAHDYELANDFATLIGFRTVLTAGQDYDYTVYLVPEGEYGKQKPVNPIAQW